jgi:hypothetical protein
MSMNVTLELNAETEDQIAERAKARGISVEDYIRDVLEEHAGNGEASLSEKATAEEWEAALLDWINTERPRHPPLSDEAISRESIYREREDAQL